MAHRYQQASGGQVLSSAMREAPKQHRIAVNGTELAWFEWGSPGDPVVLMVHATGLHARCWASTAAHLDGYHVVALDQRGHGESSKRPPFDWQQLGADLTAFLIALDLTGVNGVGHSLGGHSMVQAAASEPARFRRLCLFDPVIMAPGVYESDLRFDAERHPVARRRNDWQSPQQMFDNFKDRKPFSTWTAEALRDYCDYGLLRHGDVYKLACPPEIEASIYPGSMRADIRDLLGEITIPVAVVRAKPRNMREAVTDFSESPTWPELAAQFEQGEDLYLPEYSHFMPMENPALAAAIIAGKRQGSNGC